MARLLVLITLAAPLAGCYNPRYPDKATDAETPYRRSDAQNQATRDRRDRAAGSGATYAR